MSCFFVADTEPYSLAVESLHKQTHTHKERWYQDPIPTSWISLQATSTPSPGKRRGSQE